MTVDNVLPRPLHLPRFDRRWLLAGLVIALCLVPSYHLLRHAFAALKYDPIYDWWLLIEAAERVGTGTMYDWGGRGPGPGTQEYLYRYSPLLPVLLSPILSAGLGFFRLLHVAALLLLPRKLALALLLFPPFWFDIGAANFMVFIAIAAWFALRGNRWAMAGYFALAVLIPRPLMLPVAAWLVWKQPESRPIAVTVIAAGLVGAFLTGEGVAWIAALAQSGDALTFHWNWGPSRWLGWAWIPIGLILGAWLTWKGRLGWASLAVSPYVIPYYLLMLLVELRPVLRSTASRP